MGRSPDQCAQARKGGPFAFIVRRLHVHSHIRSYISISSSVTLGPEFEIPRPRSETETVTPSQSWTSLVAGRGVFHHLTQLHRLRSSWAASPASVPLDDRGVDLRGRRGGTNALFISRRKVIMPVSLISVDFPTVDALSRSHHDHPRVQTRYSPACKFGYNYPPIRPLLRS